MEQAVYIALDLYATQEMQEGRLDPESALNDFQTMVDADKAGRLDEVIPGASAAAEHAKKKMAAMGPGGGAPAGGAQPQKRRA
jgi:hypothetical protein